MVLLAIHGRFWSFRFHCLLSALLYGSNMCTQVSSPVSKLEITRLLQPLYVFRSSRAFLRSCVFCSSVSKWGTHLAQTFLRTKRFFRINTHPPPPVVYSTDRSKAVVPVLVLLFVALWFILRGDLLYVLPCVILFLCFFSPFSIAITSLGDERANLSAFRTFVRIVLVWICRFPLPLGVWEGLRFVTVALPGLFSYLFFYFFFFFLFSHCLLICRYKKLYLWQTIAHHVRPQSLQQRC